MPTHWLLAIVVLLFGCDLPRDPRGTLEQARARGVLRVGAAHHPPWVTVQGDCVAGSEAELVQRLAARLDLTVAWTIGGESTLLRELIEHRLDLVAAGLAADSPWGERVAFTRPYQRTKTTAGEHPAVLAVTAGENAFLLQLETLLHEESVDSGDRR
jgi:polar amino acid transport system substrate-binding protein